MPAPDDLATQLALGDAPASFLVPDELVRRARASQDVSVVVVGAVVAQDRTLLARAHRLASTAVERQLVSIALAHLEGNGGRVDDLARDQLTTAGRKVGGDDGDRLAALIHGGDTWTVV